MPKLIQEFNAGTPPFEPMRLGPEVLFPPKYCDCKWDYHPIEDGLRYIKTLKFLHRRCPVHGRMWDAANRHRWTVREKSFISPWRPEAEKKKGRPRKDGRAYK
jgi:hypothetical protein